MPARASLTIAERWARLRLSLFHKFLPTRHNQFVEFFNWAYYIILVLEALLTQLLEKRIVY